MGPRFTVHRLESYGWGPFPSCAISLKEKVHMINASLALQLADCFMTATGRDVGQHTRLEDNNLPSPGPPVVPVASPFDLDVHDAVGLRLASWPGRLQRLRLTDRVSLFLDGAHNKDSLETCAKWFKSHTLGESDLANGDGGGDVFRVLLFNVLWGRKGTDLVKLLSSKESGVDFDLAVFSTNMSRRDDERDNTYLHTSVEEQVLKRAFVYLI